MLSSAMRYLNTVVHLRPTQLCGQLIKPLRMKKLPAVLPFVGLVDWDIRSVIPELDLDRDYLSRFDVNGILNNSFLLMNERHSLDLNKWNVCASPLWVFNLHYFEYCIPLAAEYYTTQKKEHYYKFQELVLSWIASNPAGAGPGWHPYTISMRIPNLMICLALFGDTFRQDESFCAKMVQSIYVQYRVLLKRKETWQLGNHYFENLKAILLCSLFFHEEEIFARHLKLFLKEVATEIPADGVHFELSLMYHKVILEDLIRVSFWLEQAKRSQNQLLEAIKQMTGAIASLEMGMGKTPHFNDAGDGVAKEAQCLLAAAKRLFGISPIYHDSFPLAGYYKIYSGNLSVMFDAGEIGPTYMPGHGHCDCLSFELSVDGMPLFVNSGTYQYQGDYRKHFRSTSAHNTLMIGTREQSECWGEHRVARRISAVHAERGEQIISACYRTYHGDTIKRKLSLEGRVLAVEDTVETNATDVVHSYLHLPPGFEVSHTNVGLEIRKNHVMFAQTVCSACQCRIHTSGALTYYAQQFGVLQNGTTIEFFWQADNMCHSYEIAFPSI